MKCLQYWFGLLHVKNAHRKIFSIESEIPTLCNFGTSKDYKKTRQVRNSYFLLLVVFRIGFEVVVVGYYRGEVGSYLPISMHPKDKRSFLWPDTVV